MPYFKSEALLFHYDFSMAEYQYGFIMLFSMWRLSGATFNLSHLFKIPMKDSLKM